MKGDNFAHWREREAVHVIVESAGRRDKMRGLNGYLPSVLLERHETDAAIAAARTCARVIDRRTA